MEADNYVVVCDINVYDLPYIRNHGTECDNVLRSFFFFLSMASIARTYSMGSVYV